MGPPDSPRQLQTCDMLHTRQSPSGVHPAQTTTYEGCVVALQRRQNAGSPMRESSKPAAEYLRRRRAAE